MTVPQRRDRVISSMTFREINATPQPKYYCESCTKMTAGCVCQCFNRRVEPKFNRCFFHTSYSPVAQTYRSPENIQEIAYENYLREVS